MPRRTADILKPSQRPRHLNISLSGQNAEFSKFFRRQIRARISYRLFTFTAQASFFPRKTVNAAVNVAENRTVPYEASIHRPWLFLGLQHCRLWPLKNLPRRALLNPWNRLARRGRGERDPCEKIKSGVHLCPSKNFGL